MLLLGACDERKVPVTTKQNKLNLVEFVKCPFNEEFDENTDLEKYVLKNFGNPDSIKKRKKLMDINEIAINETRLIYNKNYSFEIYKWISKKKGFEIFKKISMSNFPDLKYGINKNTTTKDVEALFGKPESMSIIQRKESDKDDNTIYYYIHGPDNLYIYDLNIRFEKEKLRGISIRINTGLAL